MILALLIATLTLASSGYILNGLTNFRVARSSCNIPLIFALAAIVASTQLRDFYEASLFLLAATAQFTAFVFVSRLRQKGSFSWHSLANLGSHGTWYITLSILDASRAYWMLFIVYTFGIVVGRVAGVNWAQYVENRFNLKSDATRDNRLAPGQRLNYIKKEPAFWVLIISLSGYVAYASVSFESALSKSLLGVIGLSLAANLCSAITARASQRGNSWYIATTGLVSGLVFSIQTVFLVSKDMPMALFIPYVLSSTLGSTTGAFISMIFEWKKKIAPDVHLQEQPKDIDPWKKRLPYAAILVLAVGWIFFQETIFFYLGIPLNKLRFPISAITWEVPRILIIITAAILFFLDGSLYTVSSRAGNRNHTGYHVATLIPKGFVDFLRISYISLNDRIPDIVPVAVLSGCLGSLYGKDASEKIEKWLNARMDIEKVEVVKNLTT